MPAANRGSIAELPHLQALGWFFDKANEPCSMAGDCKKVSINLQFTVPSLLVALNLLNLGPSPASVRRHLAYVPIVRSMNPVFVKPSTIKFERLATRSVPCFTESGIKSSERLPPMPFAELSRE
jgi:hypothetical protein